MVGFVKVSKGQPHSYRQSPMASSDETFEQVLRAAQRGEEWAWQVIYEWLSGRLIGYLTMKGALDPEDQASETLLQVARNIASFEGDEDSFRSWVFVIAHRRLIDARRRQGRRPLTVDLDSGNSEAQIGDAEQEAIDRISTAEMAKVLDTLTDDQREVIVLRVLGDLSLEQTADVMGKRIGSIKALQRRAISNLRKHFEMMGVSP